MKHHWFNKNSPKKKYKVFFTKIIFIFWLLLLSTTIFYLRSAIVRINEEVLYNLEFDTQTMKLRDLIKQLATGTQGLFPNIDIIMPSTIIQEYKITKTIYAPWMYSEMAFAILLLILSILTLVCIILYAFNFDFKRFLKSNVSTYIIGALILSCLTCGILGIMTFAQKIEFWNMFSSGAIKISNWVDYVYNDLFEQLKNHKLSNTILIPILRDAISSMIPSTILIVSKQTFIDVYSYSIGSMILGILSIFMTIILYPIIVLFKLKDKKIKTKILKIYLSKFTIIFFTIFISIFTLSSSGFYLTNFIKDVTSEAQSETIDIWNTATAYTVSTLLVSLLLIFFTILVNIFVFNGIRKYNKTNTIKKLMFLK